MEFDTKKVLKHVVSGLVGAIVVSVPAVMMTENNFDGKIDLLNQDITSLNQETVAKDILIEDLNNVEPIVCPVVEPVEPVELPEYTDAEYLAISDALDFLIEYPEFSEVILDDLDDDEGDKIVERIAMLKASHARVVEYIEEEFADEMDKESVNGTVIDEDDVEDIDVDDDLEDAVLSKVDWDDEEFTWKLSVEFEQDDEDFEVSVELKDEEGEIEDFEYAELSTEE